MQPLSRQSLVAAALVLACCAGLALAGAAPPLGIVLGVLGATVVLVVFAEVTAGR